MEDWEIKAFNYAEEAHYGAADLANRDYFLEHVVHVVSILKTCLAGNEDYTNEEKQNLITACYLHDVVEDTTISYHDIRISFGKIVADLVIEVTSFKDEPKNCFPRLKTLDGYLIKYADRLSNLSKKQGMNKKHKANYMSRSVFWRKM